MSVLAKFQLPKVPEKFMVGWWGGVGWVPSEYHVLPNEVAFRVALVELS